MFDLTGHASALYSVQLGVASVHDTTTLTINDARGPNAGGSFTTLAAENTIELAAVASPDSFAPRVHWSAVDAPDDAVRSVPPASITDGASSQFKVPAGQDILRLRTPHRWITFH